MERPRIISHIHNRRSMRKYKTELCENFMNHNYCVYGDQCHFAHGESELVGRTMGERWHAGMVGGDIRTFRSRPCFDHVATGSCPFGPKCTGIHDRRVDGNLKPWLRCKQYVDLYGKNDGGASFCIDGSRETKLAQIHHGEPFGPKTETIMSSFGSFKAAVCNLNSPNGNQRSIVRDFQRIQIAKIMSNSRTFPFSNPSHLIFGRVCLILQERAFYVPSETSSSISVTEIVDEAHLGSFTASIERSSQGSIIIAREISFGAPGSPNAEEQPAIWFNIPEEDIERVVDRSIILNRQTTRSPGRDASFRELAGAISPWDPFYVYFSDRKDTRQLIEGILSLRLRELFATMKGKGQDCLGRDAAILVQDNLKRRFYAIKKDHARCHWPANEGRDVYDLHSPIPPVEGPYCIPTDPVVEGRHRRDRTTRPLRNRYAKEIWSSAHKNLRFVTSNEEKIQEEEVESNDTTRGIFASLARGETSGGASINLFVAPTISSAADEPLFSQCFDEAWSKAREQYLSDVLIQNEENQR